MATTKKAERGAKPKRAGMLVEDANAAVRTDEDGSQTIRKVADRAAEAARQGVDESSI